MIIILAAISAVAMYPKADADVVYLVFGRVAESLRGTARVIDSGPLQRRVSGLHCICTVVGRCFRK